MRHHIDPKVDCVFKALLGSETNRAFNSGETKPLVVTKVGTGAGTVTSQDGGINCGADCSENYLTGVQVTLTVQADVKSTFIGLSGACSGTGNCSITMDQARNVTATFAQIDAKLLVITKSGNGTGKITSQDGGINCGVDCTKDYPNGTQVTLTAQADVGSTFPAGAVAAAVSTRCVR